MIGDQVYKLIFTLAKTSTTTSKVLTSAICCTSVTIRLLANTTVATASYRSCESSPPSKNILAFFYIIPQ